MAADFKTNRIIAQRILRRDGDAYLFAAPLTFMLDVLEIPDPNLPFPDNRRVNKKHALDFGNYWEAHEDSWIVPPLLLDSKRELRVRPVDIDGANSAHVELEIPYNVRGSIRILDGQHRILGWYLKRIELEGRLAEATSTYNKSITSGNTSDARIASDEIDYLMTQLKRFTIEQVAVNIIGALSAEKHQQFFVDIAKNALGINKTVQAKFDSSSIVNRVTRELILKHELLVHRIDLEKTSCSGTNHNLLTVVNVADIVRHACFGVNTRVTARRESVHKDVELSVVASEFFDVMTAGFAQIKEIQKGHMTPALLREKSLLGSGTIWRCFAGAFHEVCVLIDEKEGSIEVDGVQKVSFERMLRKLSTRMNLPIEKGWFSTRLFPTRRSKAPHSRTKILK